MLVIKPIQEKTLQRDMVLRCGGAYDEAALAYIANECADDGETILHPIGICQFSLHGEAGVIDVLRCVPGVCDAEALMIMARAAMSFLVRCAFQTAVILPDAAPPELAGALGFRKNPEGQMAIDLQAFYESPCRFTPSGEK